MNNRKVFVGIIASIALILSGLIITSKFNISPKWSGNGNKTTIKDSSQATCPYYVNKDFPKEYFSNIFNEVMVTYPPTIITSSNEILALKEKFDPYKPPFDIEFYTIPKSAYPWTETKFDVDNDQKDERVLSANTAMNHTPNLALIVKNGYTVFKAKGANITIGEVGDHTGFFLSEAVDWNAGEYKTTRYLYKDGKFTPIWSQTSCVVRPQGS